MKRLLCRGSDQSKDSLAWKAGNRKVMRWATKSPACVNCCLAPARLSACGCFVCCTGWCGKLAGQHARLLSCPGMTDANREEFKPFLLKCLLWVLRLKEEGQFENAPPGLAEGWWVTPGKGNTPQLPSAPHQQWHWANHWWWAVLCSAGDSWSALACGWGGRERPYLFLAHLHEGPKSNLVETVCHPCALTSAMHHQCQALPSSLMPCSKGRSASCQDLEAYQKCIRRNSLWKVVWSSHKRRFIVFLSSSWAGVSVWTFSFSLSLSPFRHLTVQLLPGAWEPRGW